MKTSDYRGIMFNFGNEYWQKNRDLIPAVCYGIDRDAIIDAVLLGQGMPAYGPLQRNIYNYEDVEHYDYNPEKAKEIYDYCKPKLEYIRERFIEAKLPYAFLFDIILSVANGLEDGAR